MEQRRHARALLGFSTHAGHRSDIADSWELSPASGLLLGLGNAADPRGGRREGCPIVSGKATCEGVHVARS
jgi:hypothetical protein